MGRDTTLARIMHLVERAQAQRAPSQTFVDRFARIYTPVVLALAVLVAIVPPLCSARLGVDLPRARAAGDLVPVRAGDLDAGVDRVGARRAARQGVLIKGGARLERLAACAASPSTRPAR